MMLDSGRVDLDRAQEFADRLPDWIVVPRTRTPVRVLYDDLGDIYWRPCCVIHALSRATPGGPPPAMRRAASVIMWTILLLAMDIIPLLFVRGVGVQAPAELSRHQISDHQIPVFGQGWSVLRQRQTRRRSAHRRWLWNNGDSKHPSGS